MNNSSNSDRVYLLSEQTDARLYTSWLSQLDLRWEFVSQYDETWEPPADAVIVVTHHHYRLKEATILQRLMRNGSVPVLVLADGILEYRNTFEHPQIAAGAVFQPLLGHKLACIGRSQARVVESWNTHGCCEVVGLPHLDSFPIPDAVAARKPNRESAECRILIASARQPGFTTGQLDLAREGFGDLQKWLSTNRMVGSTKLVPVWRLTGSLVKDLSLVEEQAAISTGDLSDELANVDAVITTPSTLALEAMRFGIPVASIDYTNSPQYVSAAWNIRASQNIDGVVRELTSPPVAKLLFQQSTLQDSLEIRSPAAPRMCALVKRMINAAKSHSPGNHPLKLPARLLNSNDYTNDNTNQSVEIDDLYQHVPLIAYEDDTDAALIVSYQELEIARLLEKIEELNFVAAESARARRHLELAIEYFEFRRVRSTRITRLLSPRTMWFSRIQSEVLVISNLNEWLAFLGNQSKTSDKYDHRENSILPRVLPIQQPSGVMRFLRKVKRSCQENHRKRARCAVQYGTTNYWSPRHRKVYLPPSI